MLGQLHEAHSEAEHDDEADEVRQRRSTARVADDRGGEEERCDGRSDMRDVLHDRAHKTDGTGPKLGLRHPDLVGCLYEVLSAGHGSPPIS